MNMIEISRLCSKFRLSERPIAIFEDLNFPTVLGFADDIKSIVANHEVDVYHTRIDAHFVKVFLGVFVKVLYAVAKASAKGKVATCILVKESIVKEYSAVVDR